MSDELDRRLGALLRGAGVPARDPFFRIAVLERRAQELYTLRRRKLFRFGGVVAAVHAAFLALAWGMGALDAALMLLFGGGLLAAAFLSTRGVVQAWRWLRGT